MRLWFVAWGQRGRRQGPCRGPGWRGSHAARACPTRVTLAQQQGRRGQRTMPRVPGLSRPAARPTRHGCRNHLSTQPREAMAASRDGGLARWWPRACVARSVSRRGPSDGCRRSTTFRGPLHRQIESVYSQCGVTLDSGAWHPAPLPVAVRRQRPRFPASPPAAADVGPGYGNFQSARSLNLHPLIDSPPTAPSVAAAVAGAQGSPEFGLDTVHWRILVEIHLSIAVSRQSCRSTLRTARPGACWRPASAVRGAVAPPG